MIKKGTNISKKWKSLYDNKNEEKSKNNIKQALLDKQDKYGYLIDNFNLELYNELNENMKYYTGESIDTIFGLLMLYQKFNKEKLEIILDYPLYNCNTNNLDNMKINWEYQKLYYPEYFDKNITHKMKKANFIVLTIGIEISQGFHSNILLWNIKENTIERFEPSGNDHPIGYNYNPKLLDQQLEDMFKKYDQNIIFISPKEFLPNVGFQILENIDADKYKKICDPSGFCNLWCIWWIYQRMINIHNKNITIYNITDELIKKIKLNNEKFKTIIRNFSTNITSLRDNYFNKYNIDINNWITGDYKAEIIEYLQEDILKSL
jgi:hypothetical protein